MMFAVFIFCLFAIIKKSTCLGTGTWAQDPPKPKRQELQERNHEEWDLRGFVFSDNFYRFKRTYIAPFKHKGLGEQSLEATSFKRETLDNDVCKVQFLPKIFDHNEQKSICWRTGAWSQKLPSRQRGKNFKREALKNEIWEDLFSIYFYLLKWTYIAPSKHKGLREQALEATSFKSEALDNDVCNVHFVSFYK